MVNLYAAVHVGGMATFIAAFVWLFVTGAIVVTVNHELARYRRTYGPRYDQRADQLRAATQLIITGAWVQVASVAGFFALTLVGLFSPSALWAMVGAVTIVGAAHCGALLYWRRELGRVQSRVGLGAFSR